MRPSGSNKKLVLKASTNHRRRDDSGIFGINPEMSRCVTHKHSYHILNGPVAYWDDFHIIFFSFCVKVRVFNSTFLVFV